MTRDEAMRAAAWIADPSYVRTQEQAERDTCLCTAGADAELARVVEWLRGAADVDARAGDEASAKLMRSLASVFEARAHWGGDSTLGVARPNFRVTV